MKYILIYSFCLLVACNDQKPLILPAKKVERKNETRYFYIGYLISNNQRGAITWVSQTGLIPIKEDFLKTLHKDKNIIPFRDEQLMIISVYEFKDEEEMNRWDDNNN